MSPVAATARKAQPARPAPRRGTPQRPNLRVVTPVPSRAPRTPFVLFSLLVIGAGLAGLLVLNTAVAQDAFTIHDLGRSTTELAKREQRLRQEVAELEAPAAVAERAKGLGLVPAGDPVFLTANGRVLGKPAPVASPAPPAPPRPVVVAQPTAAPKPTAAAKPRTAKPTAAANPTAEAKPKPTPTGAR
jgi:cell division protein FtsB